MDFTSLSQSLSSILGIPVTVCREAADSRKIQAFFVIESSLTGIAQEKNLGEDITTKLVEIVKNSGVFQEKLMEIKALKEQVEKLTPFKTYYEMHQNMLHPAEKK